MRKVLVKKFIPIVWIDKDGNSVPSNHPQRIRSEGTGVYSDFIHEGYFAEYGIDSDDGASYTVAIVEFPDGTVDVCLLSNMKFVQPS